MLTIDGSADAGCARDEVAESFGGYLRKVRLAAGMDTRELSARVGVNPSYLYRVEVGRKAPLTAEQWGPVLEIGASAEVLTRLSDQYFAARGRQQGDRRRRKARVAERRHIPVGHPGSLSWTELSWDEDGWCQYVVAQHPDGLSSDEISALTGWSPYLVEELTQRALAKLRQEPGALEALEHLSLLRQSNDSVQMPPLSAQA